MSSRFTTGRGSAYGCKPTPSIKLATNIGNVRRMIDDMDINCGDIARRRPGRAQGARRFSSKILEVASGERTKSEALGYGDAEFVPWQSARRCEGNGKRSAAHFSRL